MKMTGDKIIELLRKPVAKIITRLILYGLVALFAKLGIDKANANETATALGEGLTSLVLFTLAAWIDKKHHDKDTGGSK